MSKAMLLCMDSTDCRGQKRSVLNFTLPPEPAWLEAYEGA